MNKNSKFNDQVVVITGASSGIGRATALEFAREGAKIVLVSRSLEKLERVANEIRSFNPNVLVVPADVSDAERVHLMVKKFCLSWAELISSLIIPGVRMWVVSRMKTLLKTQRR